MLENSENKPYIALYKLGSMQHLSLFWKLSLWSIKDYIHVRNNIKRK